MVLDNVKRCERSMFVSTVVTLVLGIVLIFKPKESLNIITGIIALFFILIGVIQIVDYFRQDRLEKMISSSLILGIILCGIGLFLFMNIDSLVNFITVVIGLSIIVKSLFKLQFAFNIRDISDKWFYNLIMGLLGIVLGIVLLLNPFKSAEVFFRIIGILLTIGSVIELIETSIVFKNIEGVRNLSFEEKEKVDEDKKDNKKRKKSKKKEDVENKE